MSSHRHKMIFEQNRQVAAICHAPWTLVEADVVRGRVLDVFAREAA
jgi:deglycase